jgi:hypothetical protein
MKFNGVTVTNLQKSFTPPDDSWSSNNDSPIFGCGEEVAYAPLGSTKKNCLMSNATRLMSGIILLTVPTIQYGGFFLLQLLSGTGPDLELTEFQSAMFRAGHAHAGVLVLLSLIIQPLCDYARLPARIVWLVRVGFPLAAILVSGGFFGAAAGEQITEPTNLIAILFVGVGILALVLVVLGIGLVRKPLAA